MSGYAQASRVLHSAERPAAASVLDAAQLICLIAFLSGCFFPFVVAQVASPALFSVLVLWAATLIELARRRSGMLAIAGWVSVPIVLACISYAVNSSDDVTLADLGQTPVIVSQYALELPVAVIAGVVLSSSESLPRLVVVLRGMAVLNALLALDERFAGRQLFPGNTVRTTFGQGGHVVASALTDTGDLRGIVASSHPLVLGALLAATLPLALRGHHRSLKIVEVGVLIAGIWATASSGPLAMAIVTLLVWIIVRLRGGRPLLRPRALDVVFVLGTIGFFVAATWWWKPEVDANNGLDPSTQYRFALFSLLPRVLAAAPLGFGLETLPRGQFLVASAGHALDAAGSVDSELVVIALQLGVIGVVAYFSIFWLSARNLVRPVDTAFGPGPLFVLTACGFVVALHVWVSAASMWEFLIGLGIAAAIRASRGSSTDPTLE